MGAYMTYFAFWDKSNATVSTQQTAEGGSRTEVHCTDRLTDYGENEVGSSEVIDNTCDLCDDGETKAAGYCRSCQQFLCLRCCRGHEKGNLNKYHTILGTEHFQQIRQQKPLFQNMVVPESTINLPEEYYLNDTLRYVAYEMSITAIEFIEDSNKIIAYDKNRNKCHLIHEDSTIKTYAIREKCHSLIKHPSKPDEFLLTNSDKHEVKNLSLSNPDKLETLFKTSGECWGIAEFDGGFAVSVKMDIQLTLPQWQVQFLDSLGKVKQRILYDKDGKALFEQPKFLASNPEKDVLYVSDCRGHDTKCVTGLNVFGEMVFKWTIPEINGIVKPLCVDNEHNVYINHLNDVVQINKDGTKKHTLLSSTKNYPTIKCVSFCTKTQRLAVATSQGQIQLLGFVQ